VTNLGSEGPSEPLSPRWVGQTEGAAEGFDLREFLRVVLKHGTLIAAILFTVVCATLVYVLTATPVWQATVTVKLPDANGGGGDGSESLKQLMSLSFSSDPVETYMEVAKSFNVAIRAAWATDLTDTAQFGSSKNLTVVAQALLKDVTVTNVKDSDILAFHVQIADRALSVRVANAWAQAFIDANLDFERTGASSRRSFIEAQMADVKVDLMNGEEALKRLAQRQGMMHRDSSGGSSGGLDPTLGLQTRVEDLLIERSELLSRYNANYPQVKAVEAQYQEASKELKDQLNKLPANEMDYTGMEREVKAHETVYNFLLEKDQEARISENADDSGIVIVDVALPPSYPVSPQKTRLMILSMLVGFLLSLSSAWSLERWQDQVGGEVEMAKLSGLPVLALIPNWRMELRAAPAAAQKVETLVLQGGAQRHDHNSLISNPELKHTYYSEAFRVLRTNLAFSEVDRKIKSISILSPNANEGKTLINANLALALAAGGGKVLLVDADLRKSSVHKLFGLTVGKDQGLPLLLSGQSTDLDAHLHPGPVPGLWILPCGVVAPNPSELLGSSALVKVLEMMTQRFDHVVFDSAPVLPVTDAVVLAARLDGVAVLARFEQTHRAEIVRALESLAAVRAPVIGTILNAVDMRRYSYAYGYRRYDSYHEKK
jgi:tyrosine-protein kinase Etk/Wzc